MDPAAAVLEFWFDPASRPLWFERNARFDALIRARFAHVHAEAARGAYAAWTDSADGALALVIVLDQFPRNMFRNTVRAFATDAMALATAEEALARGLDRVLPPERRRFLYLPFMHAESLACQRRCVALYQALGVDDKAPDAARRHLAIIERFGRFPHRNAALGRATTPEEAEFLTLPGSSF